MRTRIFTLLFAFLAIAGNAVWGQTTGTGDFTVAGESDKYSFVDGVLTIKGNVSVSTSSETDDVIVINGGNGNTPIEVTLNGVNITNDETSPISISEGSHVKLILENENTITGGDGLDDPNMKLPVALQIQSTATNKTNVEICGTGSLTAYAKHSAIGTYSETENGAASDFILTISEGTINATTYTHEDYATIGGHNSSGFTINITGGKICEGEDPYAKGWAIGGDNATINISGGEIVSLGNGNAIGGSNSKINITGGDLNLDITNTSVAIGDDSTTPKSNITISGGHIEIHSDGLSDNIQGDSFSTGEDGNPIIIIDATKTAKDYWSMNVPRTNVSEWQGIIFERQIRDMVNFGENGSGPEYSLDGYIYGDITLAENVEIVDGQTLTIIRGADFSEDDHTLSVNDGDIYLAYESENKRNEISGNGNYHYEIFYDENLKFPEELKDVTVELNTCVVLFDYLPHEHKSTWENEAYRVRYDYSNNDEEMLFGEENETLEFVWNEDAIIDNLTNPSPTKGWELESIKAVKTKTNVAIVNTTNTSFIMPGEAITITDFSLCKKSYSLTVNKCPGEFEVHFENENGDVITESVWGETVYVVVSAPGYESFNVTKIQEFDNIFGPKINVTEEKGRYYLEMPKKDVKVNIEGSAWNRQTYTIEVDENIQHGKISYECGEGVDETKIHYKDKIIVNIDEIEEGYELKSLKYIIDDTQEEVEITYNEEIDEYSFSMPAANVTITAVFEVPTSDEPDDEDKDDDDQGGGTIQKPIKYYNIYIDTVCPGLEVEVSKDVVQEGNQVSAYLTIQAECDTTGMRFEYKRGLFGIWKDLKELEGVQPGEYIIKNIYTDIYIRALDATLPEEEPTGIEDIEGAKAYAKDGSIYVYTPSREQVTIISMSGAVIKNEEQVGLQSYSVSRGIYIVRVGDKVFKLKN